MENFIAFVVGVLVVALSVAIPVGWIVNVYDLATVCDFASPYKAEVLRTVGVFFFPLGGIIGWIDIGK